MKVLIIGGVADGTKTAAKLKREDRSAEVTVITKDQDISYAGCGLPYYVGGAIESRDELIVNTPQKYSGLTGVEVRTGKEAVALDAQRKEVTVKDVQTGNTERSEERRVGKECKERGGPRRQEGKQEHRRDAEPSIRSH